MSKSAASAEATAPPEGKGEARSGRGSLAIKLGLILLVIAAFSALPLSMIAVPGMMPSLAVYCADRGRPRYQSFAVAVMNVAGVLPFMLVVARGGMTLAFAAQKLADPFTWIVMYGAAAGGWFIYAAMPSLARICVEVQAAQRRRSLEAMVKALRNEWGDEIAGRRGAPGKMPPDAPR